MSIPKLVVVGILIINVISIAGCSPNKESLKNNLSFPSDFVIEKFNSDSNNSALHGPMYFSFLSSDEDFKNINGLNNLLVISATPEAYSYLMKEAIMFAESKVWPSLGRIDRFQIYSNHEDINPNTQEYPSLLMTFHKAEKMYVIVFPLY